MSLLPALAAGQVELLASASPSVAKELREAISRFHAAAREHDPKIPAVELPDGFATEQLWAALELANGKVVGRLGKRAGRVRAEAEEARRGMLEAMRREAEEGGSEEDGGEEGEEAQEGEEDLEDGVEGSDDVDELKEGSEDDGGSEAADDASEEAASDAPQPASRPRRDTSAVDDDFFRLEDMERFAAEFEDRDVRRADADDDPEPEFDLDADPDAGREELEDIMYEDFFDPLPGGSAPRPSEPSRPSGKKKDAKGVRFADEEEEDDYYEDREDEILERRPRPADPELPSELDEGLRADRAVRERFGRGRDLLADDEEGSDGEEEEPSTFEKQQRRLKEQIQKLEDEAMADKCWALKGEVSSRDRPQNSLLEEALVVDVGSKPAPVITEEKTHSLEDLIRQRIKDGAFDDVERRADELALLQARGAFDPNRGFELSDEKSKQSLGEVYESEYLKQVTGNRQTEKDAKLQKQHAEIDGLMKQLFADLDALSNWHYVPRAPKAELEVRPQTMPAIEMEEVIPLAVSEAALAAPEEVYAKPRNERELKDASEMTAEERKRARAARKREKKAERKSAEELRKLKDLASPGRAKRVSAGEEKKAALKQLAKNRNVTIVADGKGGLPGGKVAERKRKAAVVEKGGSAKKQRFQVTDVNHLKL
ncbi:U3 small nucleolar ribonucleoprotein complex, subunit Mpp10 [Hyaloraphidium curvatum]|nr:U3 small nucleolar ribonucleoprotein complex, subunit Mpp10 [Hyaloraphidium curvatum]